MRAARWILGMAVVGALAAPAAAQFGDEGWGKHKAEGAVVVRDGAPAYESKSSMEVKRTFKRGDAVVGFHREMMATNYELFEENGRYMVGWPKEDSALMQSGWMDVADVQSFVYDCGCEMQCIPTKGSLKRAEWNPCFREALSEARGKLPAAHQESPVEAPPPAPAHQDARPQAGKEKPLTNDAIVAMVKADLGDELVIAKIQQAPSEALDVSAEALVALRQQGVSKAVLDAMIKRAGH
jgi:hypothetical protein